MSHGTPGRAGREGLGGRPGWCPRVWYPGCGTRVFLESFPGVLPERRRAAARSGVVPEFSRSGVVPEFFLESFLESSRNDGGRLPQSPWIEVVVGGSDGQNGSGRDKNGRRRAGQN